MLLGDFFPPVKITGFFNVIDFAKFFNAYIKWLLLNECKHFCLIR
jgi:hypothetical protein